MGKALLWLAIIIGAFIYFGNRSGSPSPTTRGEVRDRIVASDAERCAKQYLGKPNSGPNSEIWIMCAQVSASLEKRDPVNIAKQIVRQQGWNVFEFENRSGSNSELSAAGIARIASGE